MDDKDLDVGSEDDFNLDDLDDLDFTLEGDDEEGELEKPKPEEKEVLAPIEDARITRLEADLAAAKAEAVQAAKDREEAWEEADKVRTNAITGAMTQWQADLAREQREALTIQQQFERAKMEQDADKVEGLIAKYNDKQQLINQLSNNLNNAQAQLNNKPERKKAAVSTEVDKPKRSAGEQMADKWVSENSWYNDPTHMDKRKIVDDLCAKAVAAKYDPSSLKFWNYIDKEVEALSSKKDTPRRTPPAVRPTIKQGGSQTVSDNKKKIDSEILRASNAALERAGFTKTHPDYERRQKSYYKTYFAHAQKTKVNNV